MRKRRWWKPSRPALIRWSCVEVAAPPVSRSWKLIIFLGAPIGAEVGALASSPSARGRDFFARS